MAAIEDPRRAPHLRTQFYTTARAAGARMVEFGGWEMPLQYAAGIFEEHLATRRDARPLRRLPHGPLRLPRRWRGGLPPARPDQQRRRPRAGRRRSTRWSPTSRGGAVDDAYLYRFVEERVPARRQRLQPRARTGSTSRSLRAPSPTCEMIDRHRPRLAMIALQGPRRARDPGGPVGTARTARAACATPSRRDGDSGRRGRDPHRPDRVHGEPHVLRALRGRRDDAPADLGRYWSRPARPPSASAPATPSAWRPACRSTATNSAPTPKARRSPSSPARWRGSR